MATMAQAQLPAPWEFYPFPGAVGTSGTTAMHMNSASFVGWADGYTALRYGTSVAGTWMTPTKALNQATGDAYDIVCLGRGGEITLTFSTPISNEDGYDFAVFENACSDIFLELAWVEVSSDGTNFCRFPNYYGGTGTVGAFGGHSPTDIYGLASKYRQGYGTPFDLEELQTAYNSIQNSTASFLSSVYADSTTDNFPLLDLNNIGYVRLIDIVGDGSAKDATGRTIYDPYPTVGSAGFDLDAIGVINQRQTPDLLPQVISFETIPNQKLVTGLIDLGALSDSGLPVVFTVSEGLAALTGTTLSFTNSGTIVITASQSGDETYAPAANVVRSFVVTEQIQHIYLAPIPNMTENMEHQLYAVSSAGLPVVVEVTAGDAIVDASHLITIGNAGFGGASDKIVTLRAYQKGDASTAPAEDVSFSIRVVPTTSPHIPQTFAQWCSTQSITNSASADNDNDGFNNFEEFMAGTDPELPLDKPQRSIMMQTNSQSERTLAMEFRIRRRALATLTFRYCGNLGATWSDIVPYLQNVTYTEEAETEYTNLKIELPAQNTRGFYRMRFNE